MRNCNILRKVLDFLSAHLHQVVSGVKRAPKAIIVTMWRRRCSRATLYHRSLLWAKGQGRTAAGSNSLAMRHVPLATLLCSTERCAAFLGSSPTVTQRQTWISVTMPYPHCPCGCTGTRWLRATSLVTC
jgi:hypothetical protein